MYCSFVPNLEAISPVTFVLETRKLCQKFGVKCGLIQKRLKYGKNISHGDMF